MKKNKKTTKKIIKKTKVKTAKPKIVKKKSKKIWKKNVATIKKRIETSLANLKRDIKRKAPFEKIEKDNNELLMLLGECNYVIREFHEHQIKK